MILAFDVAERDGLLADLLRERFDLHTPDPIPTAESSSVTARRRRELCLVLDGFYRDDRPNVLEAA